MVANAPIKPPSHYLPPKEQTPPKSPAKPPKRYLPPKSGICQ